MALKARVIITLKQGVLDPQGVAISGALANLGFQGVDSVRQGKVIELEIGHDDKTKATADLNKMCEMVLANTVIENYTIEWI